MSTLKENLLSALGRQLPGANLIDDACKRALDGYLDSNAFLARSVLLALIANAPGDAENEILRDICEDCRFHNKPKKCDFREALSDARIIQKHLANSNFF